MARWPLALVLVVYALRGLLLAPLLRQAIDHWARESLGSGLEVGSIRGSYFGSLVLQDARTTDTDDTAGLRRLEWDRLEVDFALIAWLFGRGDLVASVAVTGLLADVDLDRVLESIDPSAEGGPWPDSLPAIAVIQAAVTLQVDQQEWRLAGLAIEGTTAGTVTLRTVIQAPSEASDPGRETPLALALRYSPKAIEVTRLEVAEHDIVDHLRMEPGEHLPSLRGWEVSLNHGASTFESRARLESATWQGGFDLALDAWGPLATLVPAFKDPRLAEAQVQFRGQWSEARLEVQGSAITSAIQIVLAPTAWAVTDAPSTWLPDPLPESVMRVDCGDLGVLTRGAASGRARLLMHLRGTWAEPDLQFEGSVPDLVLGEHVFADAQVAGRGRFATATEQLVIPYLSVESKENRIRLEQVETSFEALRQYPPGGRALATLQVRGLDALQENLGSWISLSEGLPLHHFEATVRYENGALSLAEDGFLANDGQWQVSEGLLSLATPFAESPIQLRGRCDVPLASWQELAGQTLSGQLHGDLIVTGPVRRPLLAVDLQGEEVQVSSFDFGHVELQGTLQDQRAQVTHLSSRAEERSFEVGGVVDLGTQALEEVAGSVVWNDLQTLLPTAQGQVHARFRAAGPWQTPKGDVTLTMAGGRLFQQQIQQARLDLEAAADRVAITHLEVHTAEASLEATAMARRDPDRGAWVGALDSLRLHRESWGPPFDLAMPAGLEWQGEALEFGPLVLRSDHGELGLTAGGTFDNPEVSLRAALESIHSPVGPLALQLAAHLEDQRLVVEEAALSGATGSAHLTASIPVDFSQGTPRQGAPLDLVLELESEQVSTLLQSFWNGPIQAGRTNLRLVADGAWPEVMVRGHLRVHDIDAKDPDKALTPGVLTADFRFAGAHGQLESLALESPRGVVEVHGEWRDVLDWEDLGNPLRNVDRSTLSLEGTTQVQDLAFLAALFPEVRRTAGALRGQFALAGPLRAPDYRGELLLTRGELRVARPGVATLAAMDGRLVLDGRELQVADISGELGYAPFTLSGTIGLDGARPVFDLSLEGQDLLLYRTLGLKVRANTDLRLTGPLKQMQLSGAVELTDAKFTRKMDLIPTAGMRSSAPRGPPGLSLFTLSDPPLRDLQFQVSILSERPAEIRNNVAQADLRPKLELTGTGEFPVLVGDVYLDRGRVSLPASTLRLSESTVRFVRQQPNQPELNIQGETRLHGFDVRALVTGSMDEPDVLLSSTPAAPQEELLLLLLVGQDPGSALDRDTGQRSLSSLAVFLGKDLLRRMTGDESTETDEGFLSRFELQVGSNLTREGADTIESRFRLRDDWLRTGSSLYLEGERSTFDELNLGLRLILRYR